MLKDDFNEFRDKLLNLKVINCEQVKDDMEITFEDKTKFEISNTIYHKTIVTKLENIKPPGTHIEP